MGKISYKLSQCMLEAHGDNLDLNDGISYASALLDADDKLRGRKFNSLKFYEFCWKVAYNRSIDRQYGLVSYRFGVDYFKIHIANSH